MENSGPPAVEVWNADIPQVRGNSLLGPGGLVDQNGIEANAIQVFVDDALPVEEGLAASFTIRLSQPANAPVIVSYHTRDGSAIGTQADDTGDYRATDASNTLVFLPGETKKTVVVATNDDAVEEDTEHFTLRVTHATSSVPVRIADGSGLGTILDNDGGDELEEDFGDVFEEEVPVEPPIVVPHDDGDELPDPSTTPGGKPDVIDLPPSVSPNAFGTSLPQGPADGHVPGAPDPPEPEEAPAGPVGHVHPNCTCLPPGATIDEPAAESGSSFKVTNPGGPEPEFESGKSIWEYRGEWVDVAIYFLTKHAGDILPVPGPTDPLGVPGPLPSPPNPSDFPEWIRPTGRD